MASKTEHETDKGTGKHPHKDSEEPYPHTERSGGKQESSHQGSTGSRSSGKGESNKGGSSSSDEKSREYKDKDGNIHHHTHTYEEQHKK
jgi:hypothetical protein